MIVKVTFTRKFYRGNLVGLTHDDTISFVNVKLAKEWLNGIEANRSKLDYEIVEFKIN